MRRMTENRRIRMHMMLWAYLTFHMRNRSKALREEISWAYLLEWAMRGGRADEVIGLEREGR